MGSFEEDIIQAFVVEAREHLADIEAELLALEELGDNLDAQIINKVFRAAHSIKGGAGMLNFDVILKLSHLLESVLVRLRDGAMKPSADVFQCLLISFDRLKDLVEACATSNQADISDLLPRLNQLLAQPVSAPESNSGGKTARSADKGKISGDLINSRDFDLAGQVREGKYVYHIRDYMSLFSTIRDMTPVQWVADLEKCGTILAIEPAAKDIEAIICESSPDVDITGLKSEVLYSTIMDPTMLAEVLEGLDGNRLELVVSPEHANIDATPAPAPAPPPSQPVTAPPPPPPPTAAAPPPVAATPQSQPPAEKSDSKTQAVKKAVPVVEETLRVNVRLLENLMNLAGELVLGRNQLLDAIKRSDMRLFRDSGSRINAITSELQETIMLTRMQPVGLLMSKCQRIVRDLARELDKNIVFEVEGRDVEMDKAIIEGLTDPMLHMLRNSTDHGIEDRRTRVACGKPEKGLITFRAMHTAGQVVVQISDDGKGIDPEKVLASAQAKGLVTSRQARGMSRQEMLELIFLPGFSTAEKVTDVSGRGVGMDVVKSNIERLGGTVTVDSELGAGTMFTITLPLTLAIIPSLLLSAGGERFAVPQVNVKELLRIPAARVKDQVELVGDREVLRLRDQLLPFIRLAEVLGLSSQYVDPDSGEVTENRRVNLADRRSPRHLSPEGSSVGSSVLPRRHGQDRRYHADSDLNVAVLAAGPLEYALAVDVLHDTVEIVVRPLGEHIKCCREYAGATILGDGQVAIIIDAAGLAGKAQLASVSERIKMHRPARAPEKDDLATGLKLLLFHNTPTEPCAIPLHKVLRLEKITSDQMECMGGVKTMQCRGGQLPLLTMGDFGKACDLAACDEYVAIVLEGQNGEVGIIGSMPVDIVESDGNIDKAHRSGGILGSCIVRGRTTLLVDADSLRSGLGVVGQ